MQQAMCRRRRDTARDAELGDRMPAVGREFGSPDFERLMAEDHKLARAYSLPRFVRSFRQPHTGHLRAETAEIREEAAPRHGTGVARRLSRRRCSS
jgi:hypothetical protein